MSRPGRSGGFALVSVLWIVLLVSMIAATLMAGGRLGLLRTRHAVEATQARAMADAAVDRVTFELLRAYLAGLPDPRPQRLTLPLEGGTVDVTIEDEDGKIDLNRTDTPLLAGLLVQAGVPAQEAAALVDAIADYRDIDSLRRPAGAEDEDYIRLGLPAGAKDAPFERLDELLQVAGMTPDLFRRVAPALTVHSGRATLDPTVAPRQAILAMPGVDAGLAEFLSQFRPGRPRSSGAPLPDLSKVQTALSPSRREVFTLRAVARTPAGVVFVREAVIRLSRDANKPYSVLEWRQGELPETAPR